MKFFGMKLTYRKVLSLLYIFVPISIASSYITENQLLLFITSALGLIPLAELLGHATEELAKHSGKVMGAFLNSTFGNATEFMVSIFAIKTGLFTLVKADLMGSFIGNLLLVVGLCFFIGGLKFKQQEFSLKGATTNSTMLTMAIVGLMIPTLFTYISGETKPLLSLEISFVLIMIYFLGLFFSMKTHKDVFNPNDLIDEKPEWSKRKSVFFLALATFAVGFEANILVGTIQTVSEMLGLSQLFIGIIIIAGIGNVAAISTGIMQALKNRMDLSLNIAIGSSNQVALFITPMLVFISYILGNPMDLVFNIFTIIALGISLFVLTLVCIDGKSDWLEGAQLLSVYLILAFLFLSIS